MFSFLFLSFLFSFPFFLAVLGIGLRPSAWQAGATLSTPQPAAVPGPGCCEDLCAAPARPECPRLSAPLALLVLSPGPQRKVALSQEGPFSLETSLPTSALPLSPASPSALICSRKFPSSPRLFPFISPVPTGTWEVGCAQRLERKLQQDNFKGTIPS